MKISIIIPTFNHLTDCLKPCIDSILKYTDLTDKEIIIVSNGSTDGTQEYVNELNEAYKIFFQKPFILLDYPEPLGYAKAVNEGIKVSNGDYIVLLNNDTVLLEQKKDTWINMLLKPFDDSSVGITGPIKGYSDPAGKDFIIFFCAMLKREVIDKLGLLSEEFGVGGGEDTSYCIEAEQVGFKTVQVPEQKTNYENGLIVGGFPIYHAGEKTMNDNPDWKNIFDDNSLTLAKKYNREWYKNKISNNYERAVFLKDEEILPREKSRYEWAAQNLTGFKIAEIGSSNGYGTRLLPSDINYAGFDYDDQIIKVANEIYGDKNHIFICLDITKGFFTSNTIFDTIIAFEVIEHLDNGLEIVERLKNHCDTLLITVPYKEPVGFWGVHHKLHNLDESMFKDFEIKYMNDTGIISDKPAETTFNLMLLKWTKK